jgi:hypothetical protein
VVTLLPAAGTAGTIPAIPRLFITDLDDLVLLETGRDLDLHGIVQFVPDERLSNR